MKSLDDLPPITVNLGTDLCNFHPLPWKETWNEPKTVIVVIGWFMQLFDALVNDADFIKKCKGQLERINKNMPRPLCCWVAVNYPDKLREAYEHVGVIPPDASEIARNN